MNEPNQRREKPRERKNEFTIYIGNGDEVTATLWRLSSLQSHKLICVLRFSKNGNLRIHVNYDYLSFGWLLEGRVQAVRRR